MFGCPWELAVHLQIVRYTHPHPSAPPNLDNKRKTKRRNSKANDIGKAPSPKYQRKTKYNQEASPPATLITPPPNPSLECFRTRTSRHHHLPLQPLHHPHQTLHQPLLHNALGHMPPHAPPHRQHQPPRPARVQHDQRVHAGLAAAERLKQAKVEEVVVRGAAGGEEGEGGWGWGGEVREEGGGGVASEEEGEEGGGEVVQVGQDGAAWGEKRVGVGVGVDWRVVKRTRVSGSGCRRVRARTRRPENGLGRSSLGHWGRRRRRRQRLDWW